MDAAMASSPFLRIPSVVSQADVWRRSVCYSQAYEDVSSLVCDAYKGPPPAYCGTKVAKRTNGLKGVSPRDKYAGAVEVI